MLGALENHVFYKMRNAIITFVLITRSNIDPRTERNRADRGDLFRDNPYAIWENSLLVTRPKRRRKIGSSDWGNFVHDGQESEFTFAIYPFGA
jgi:hypothetical protein